MIMSTKHLSKDSEEPPKVEGLLRLYAMKFCPFSHRARLILKAKGVPHDIVYINLVDKPKWYSSINPDGKVPALDTGSKIVVDSLDICNHLEELYPETSLYPSDQEAAKNDRELIEKIEPIISVWAKCVFKLEVKSAVEWLKEFTPHLDLLQSELIKRGTRFFGGDKPGMVDYMLWPWAERSPCVGIVLQEKLPFEDDKYVKLIQWKKHMREEPIVDDLYIGPLKFWKIAETKLTGTIPDYDNV